MTPYFSILIPVFNKAGQMDECIESLKAQSFTDFEVVFVNDGSTDSSADDIARFCAADGRFRSVSHEKNSSVMTARCTGMREAKGRYILFIDSDDVFSPDTCESLHELLSERPVDIVRFDIIEEPKMHLRAAEKFPEGEFEAYMQGKISPTVWKNCFSKAVTERALSRITPFYSNMAEDLFLSAVLYHCAESFAVLNRTFYHYRMGSGMSTVYTVTPEKMKRDMDSLVLVADNLYAYTDRYCPEKRGAAEELIKRNMRYIFLLRVWKDSDPVNLADVIFVLNTDRTRWLYEEVCREVLPALVRRRFRLTDDKMDLVGAKYDKFTWFDDLGLYF
jgi:glycosyltransferase involved in cell wall biosynthesis